MEMSGLCDLLPLSFTLFQNGTEIMKTGLCMYLSVGGFLLRGDLRIQGNRWYSTRFETNFPHESLLQIFFSEMSGTYLC